MVIKTIIIICKLLLLMSLDFTEEFQSLSRFAISNNPGSVPRKRMKREQPPSDRGSSCKIGEIKVEITHDIIHKFEGIQNNVSQLNTSFDLIIGLLTIGFNYSLNNFNMN